jgi:hypothetical protein
MPEIRLITASGISPRSALIKDRKLLVTTVFFEFP